MYQSLCWDGKAPFVDTADYLSRHDIVYRTPALEGYEGLPVGNGAAGGGVYHTQNTLEWPLNHCDAVDFAPGGPFRAWAWEEEERHTAPFMPGRLRVRSPLPLFHWPYLEQFEERLSLGDATLTGQGVTPFADYRYRIFGTPQVFVVEWELRQREASPLTVELERWGTANFFHHYEQVVRGYRKGLDGTAAAVEGDTAWVLHQARGGASAIGVRLHTGEGCAAAQTSSHGCELRFASAKTHRFTLHIAVEAAPTAAQAKDKAAARLKAAAAGEDLHREHAAGWRRFWNRSFVRLPDGYLENLYYIHLYQLQCCAQGKYPPLFGGLWTWFGDSRNWGHFYHWNHQQTCWGLYPAGQLHLAQNYLDYRWGMVERAREDARAVHGAQGVFYSDISSLTGNQAHEPDTVRNCTVAAQIALDFCRHYHFTGDEAFLADKAAPLVREAMAFYSSRLVKEEDGRYRLEGGSTCYESYWTLRETLTDYAAVKSLLTALFQLPPELLPGEDTMERYRDIDRNLYQCPTTWVERDGERVEIFAAGTRWDNAPVGYGEGDYPMSPFPATLHSMVYPSGVVGLENRESPMFRLAQNTARVLFDRDVYRAGTLGCSGHSPSPQMAARLGMGEDTWRILRRYAQTYQVFPNGLMHFADIGANQQWSRWDTPRVLEEDVAATAYEQLHDKSRGPRTKIDSRWFLHPYFEAAACMADSIQESLLQSHDGVIRLFPAMEEGADALYRLHARGGVVVTAEMTGGQVRYGHFQAERACKCRVESPWPGRTLGLARGGEPVPFRMEGDLCVFEVGPEGAVVLFPADAPLDGYYTGAGLECPANPAPKHWGKVQIGLDAIY